MVQGLLPEGQSSFLSLVRGHTSPPVPKRRGSQGPGSAWVWFHSQGSSSHACHHSLLTPNPGTPSVCYHQTHSPPRPPAASCPGSWGVSMLRPNSHPLSEHMLVLRGGSQKRWLSFHHGEWARLTFTTSLICPGHWEC